MKNNSEAIMTPLWKQRNFLLLMGGQCISWVGSEVSGIALPLIVLAFTGSPAQAGGVAAMRGLAYMLWAIPAGLVMDRLDRRKIMVIANLGSGLAIGSIALALALHRLSMLQLYIVGIIEGSFFVFASLGRMASFPRTVPKEQLPEAYAQGGMVDSLALLIGPPLGGFLYQAFGGFITFLADALSYFINALSIFFINVPLSVETPAERKRIHHEISEAAVWFWKQPIMVFLNLLTAGRASITAGLYLLVVVLAKEHHASSGAIGIIFAMGAVGGILGSLVSAKLHNHFSMKQLLVGLTFFSFLVFTFYAVAVNVLLLAAVTTVFYALDPLYNVVSAAYSAKTIPDGIRGRVLSLNRLTAWGAHSFGFFVAGNILQYLGSAWAIGLLSAWLFVLFLATAVNKKLAIN